MKKLFALFFLVSVLVGGDDVLGGSPVRSLLAENRTEEAAAVCRQFEVVTVNDMDNTFACAWAYFRTNRVESAEKILARNRKAFTMPEYQLLFAYSRIKKKQYEEARKILNLVQTEQKGTPYSLTAQELSAEIYELKGQLDTAAFIYKQVAGDDPNRARAHWGLGRYYLGRGDTGRAKTHLETTAKLWPKHVGCRYNLAVLHISQESLGDAAKWLAEAYKLDKADPGVLEQLGLLFEKRGMLSEAIRHWQRALEIKKDSSLAKEKLARYKKDVLDDLMDARKWDSALEQIEASGKDVKNDSKLLLKRAIVLRNLGKYEKSSADLQVYLNAKPKDPIALRELGICYINMKQMEQAQNQFVKAIDEEPSNGINLAWLAFVLESRGDFGGALEAWRKAVEYLQDPAEMEKAQRKIAMLERKLSKKDSKSERK